MTQRRILVVEDERAIREMVCFNLARAGFDAAPAGDAREARAAIADRCPDLVLMDWMLPDISGLELTRQLKRDPNTKEIPVIMLTARGEEDDRVAGLDGGAARYRSNVCGGGLSRPLSEDWESRAFFAQRSGHGLVPNEPFRTCLSEVGCAREVATTTFHPSRQRHGNFRP